MYFEGFILGCIGIPIGILCGIGGIAVTLRALSDSFMKTVMVATGDSVRLHAIVNWKILVGSVLISAPVSYTHLDVYKRQVHPG